MCMHACTCLDSVRISSGLMNIHAVDPRLMQLKSLKWPLCSYLCPLNRIFSYTKQSLVIAINYQLNTAISVAERMRNDCIEYTMHSTSPTIEDTAPNALSRQISVLDTSTYLVHDRSTKYTLLFFFFLEKKKKKSTQSQTQAHIISNSPSQPCGCNIPFSKFGYHTW